jgi:hypothetical protein
MISGYPSFRSILYGVLVFQTQKLLLVTNFGKPTSGILNVFAKKKVKWYMPLRVKHMLFTSYKLIR